MCIKWDAFKVIAPQQMQIQPPSTDGPILRGIYDIEVIQKWQDLKEIMTQDLQIYDIRLIKHRFVS